MAFTTTTGAGGTSLIGTSGVDSTSIAGNTFPLYIGAQAANDVVLLTGTSSSVRAELGKGADNFTASGSLSASTVSGNLGNDVIALAAISGSSALVNGNQGADTFTIGGNISSGARVLGGADNDTINISAGVTVSSGGLINGNKGDDTITATTSATTSSSTIYGGQGNDTMTGGTTAGAVVAGVVAFSGDSGNDTITGSTTTAASTTGDTLYGGAGNDRINASAFVSSTGVQTIDFSSDTLYGGEGVDTFGSTGNQNAAAVAFGGAGSTLTAASTFAGADVIYDFVTGSSGDVIDIGGSTAFTWGGSKSVGDTIAAGTYYAISGTWTNGTFVPSLSGQGIDTLIASTGAAVAAADTLLVTGNAVVLKGIVNTQVVTANLI